MKIMDCTLRDGGNVIGAGFPAELTTLMLKGLTENGVTIIEMGNCAGLGMYDKGVKAPCTDDEYLELARPFTDKVEVGMFLQAGCATPEIVAKAAKAGLKFLRVGINAGDGAKAVDAVKMVKAAGMKAFFAMMKAYVLSPEELVKEAQLLEAAGVDVIIIMDSAGMMLPKQAAAYTKAVSSAVRIPVGFHGHANLGCAVANAVAAAENGAQIIDCGLMGMARSAGNIATETAVAALDRDGVKTGADMYGLFRFIDNELAPAMKPYGYRTPAMPLDIVLGYSGCHSHYIPMFKEVAAAKGVDLYKLIIETSKLDMKNPSRELMESVADKLSA